MKHIISPNNWGIKHVKLVLGTVSFELKLPFRHSYFGSGFHRDPLHVEEKNILANLWESSLITRRVPFNLAFFSPM